MNSYRSLTKKLFEPAFAQPQGKPQPALWFILRKYRLLVQGDEEQVAPPIWTDPADAGLETTQRHYLGTLDGVACFAAEVETDDTAPPGMRFQGLRSLYGLMDEDFFWIGGRALQIIDWERTHRYCGRCATVTQPRQRERARKCPKCGLTVYPQLAPAVIVAITYREQILLARSHQHPPGRFSVLAGFVEPGETLEQCVIREVREEVGLEVNNLRYFGSQPWPFPHSLMIAFTCESAGDQIVLQDEELAEAGWFDADALPNIPPPLTISRHLIDAFVAQNGHV